MTKEERKEYNRKHYQDNKEKKAAYNKAWNLKNKEKKAAYSKFHNEANKEKKAVQKKAWIEDKKDGLYTVYLIVNGNYVGQTDNLYARLATHKSKHKRDVSNIQILGKYKTREEAMKVEAEYHSKGYLGYNNGC